MDINFSFNGVGYNGPHLAAMTFEKFKKEIAHHHTGPDADKAMKQLYDLLQETYNPKPLKESGK
jgi:hypothetical protein